MPAVSQKQRSLIYAKFGPAFAKKHHFDNPGKLPERVGGRSKKKKGSKSSHRRADKLAQIVREAR